eukprot:scaffold273_cov127-Isochrysis_galbana.AAC.1
MYLHISTQRNTRSTSTAAAAEAQCWQPAAVYIESHPQEHVLRARSDVAQWGSLRVVPRGIAPTPAPQCRIDTPRPI